jgi:hypothetical protein
MDRCKFDRNAGMGSAAWAHCEESAVGVIFPNERDWFHKPTRICQLHLDVLAKGDGVSGGPRKWVKDWVLKEDGGNFIEDRDPGDE